MVSQKQIINIAIEEAMKSDHKHFKHGAVLTMGKKIISYGHNKTKSPNDNLPYKSIHAEMETIRIAKQKYGNNLDNCVIYVVRINGNGCLGSSRPCIHCTNLIKKHGIKNIYFSTNDSTGI